MSGHRTDDGSTDPFAADLGSRLHAAADHVDGTGLTRSGVAAAVERERRRRARARTIAVGAAAAVALLGGLAVATRSGDGAPQEVITATPSTTEPACTPAPVDTGPAGWFRLSDEQADALLAAGAITQAQADGHVDHAVLLTHTDLQVLDDPEIGPLSDQLFDLGYEDSAGLELLRSEGRLTAEQEADIADRIAPELDQAQVDRVLEAFPDLLAIAPGGQPFPTGGGTEFAPAGGSTASTTAAPTGAGACEGGG